MKREVQGPLRAVLPVRLRRRQQGRARPAARTRRSRAELSPVRLPRRQRRAAGRREALSRHQADGDGLPRPQPARVRADQARQPARRSTRWRCSSCARPAACTVSPARSAVRPRRPRPLLPAHQVRGAVSIPCVAGPYTSVNCTLTLLKSTIRTDASSCGTALRARAAPTTPRFSDYFGSLQVDRHQLGAERQRPVRDRTCATSATCRSRAPARSASGSWSCRPTRARATRASSTTTRSATSSCTCATPPARAAGRCVTARSPT